MMYYKNRSFLQMTVDSVHTYPRQGFLKIESSITELNGSTREKQGVCLYRSLPLYVLRTAVSSNLTAF